MGTTEQIGPHLARYCNFEVTGIMVSIFFSRWRFNPAETPTAESVELEGNDRGGEMARRDAGTERITRKGMPELA